jgi:hypothetical protein
MKLREGENIQIVEDGEDVFIHAKLLNQTVLKSGPFTLSGRDIEIVSGEHIRISSAHPNTLIITANIDQEKARIADLTARVKNLETVISILWKEREDARSNGKGTEEGSKEEGTNR